MNSLLTKMEIVSLIEDILEHYEVTVIASEKELTKVVSKLLPDFLKKAIAEQSAQATVSAQLSNLIQQQRKAYCLIQRNKQLILNGD